MTRWAPPSSEVYTNTLSRLFGLKAEEILSLSFQVTEDCNMCCTYCYQHNKSHNVMTFDVARQIVDNILSDKYHTASKKAIVIDFIGGEPFLQIDLITQITEYFISQCIKLNHRFLSRFRISIATNGLLYFKPEVQAYLRKFKDFVAMSVSIDGNKRLHDTCRIDKSGNGTYDRAIKAEHHYVKHYGTRLQTKFTISPQNVQYIYDAILNLLDEGYYIIDLNYVYEEGWQLPHAKIFYQQLKKLSDYLFEHDAFQKYSISLFNSDYFIPMLPDDNTNWCGGVHENMLAFDYQGRMFPCIRYMDSSLNGKQVPYCIGTIDGYSADGEERLKVLNAISRHSQSTDECFNCPIGKGCSWCSGYNYECFGTPDRRATFICIMHKARALANYYYFNKGYKLLGDDTRLPIYISEDDALQIVTREEWNELWSL